MRLGGLAVCIRILVSLFTRTFFQPDEYFQALEPAHNIVFGYGALTWEWLTSKPIRSIIYPAVNVPIYLALKASGLADHALIGDWLLVLDVFQPQFTTNITGQINIPKIVHGSFAAATDVWLCEVARRVLGIQYVSTAVSLLTQYIDGSYTQILSSFCR